MNIDRREFLKGAGALIVSFSLPEIAFAQAQDPRLQQLDAWLAVAADGQVTVYCGKVELGTGVQTALAQIVAEELDVAFGRVFMLMGDTALFDLGDLEGQLGREPRGVRLLDLDLLLTDHLVVVGGVEPADHLPLADERPLGHQLDDGRGAAGVVGP